MRPQILCSVILCTSYAVTARGINCPVPSRIQIDLTGFQLGFQVTGTQEGPQNKMGLSPKRTKKTILALEIDKYKLKQSDLRG